MHIGTTIIQNCWHEAELRPLFGWVEKHQKCIPNTTVAHSTQEGVEPDARAALGHAVEGLTMSPIHRIPRVR